MSVLYTYVIEKLLIIRTLSALIAAIYWIIFATIKIAAFGYEEWYESESTMLKKLLVPCGIIPTLLIIFIPSEEVITEIFSMLF